MAAVRSRLSRTGWPRHAALAVGLALLLGACSAATADQGPATPGEPSAAAFPDGPGPSDTPDPALAGQPVPTRPPGDPDGPDAEDSAAEGGDQHEGTGHGHPPQVPVTALLDTGTVAALAGGSWSASRDVADACLTATAPAALAHRSSVLSSVLSSVPSSEGTPAAGGRLAQTVARWAGVRAAEDAVATTVGLLVDCGFDTTGDPRLGDASAALERPADGSPERAMVIASEGVTVLIVGSGSAAAPGAWESLADIALGSSCAAAEHGCH